MGVLLEAGTACHSRAPGFIFFVFCVVCFFLLFVFVLCFVYLMLCCIEYTSPLTGFELITLMVIDTDWKGSCKSNYQAITTTMAPHMLIKMFVGGLISYCPFLCMLAYSDVQHILTM
jgi:hypothetical protein